MALTSAQKSAERAKRMGAVGKKRVHNLWATVEHERMIKEFARLLEKEGGEQVAIEFLRGEL